MVRVEKNKIISLFLFTFIFLVLAQHTANAQSGITKRVQFPKGKHSATIRGSIAAMKKDTYVFRAKENQSITINVEWLGTRKGPDEQLSGFVFVHADGTEEEDPQSDVFVAGEDGDYKVIVRTKSRRSTTRYVLTVTIQ